jgi:hypothetical protein
MDSIVASAAAAVVTRIGDVQRIGVREKKKKNVKKNTANPASTRGGRFSRTIVVSLVREINRNKNNSHLNVGIISFAFYC